MALLEPESFVRVTRPYLAGKPPNMCALVTKQWWKYIFAPRPHLSLQRPVAQSLVVASDTFWNVGWVIFTSPTPKKSPSGLEDKVKTSTIPGAVTGSGRGPLQHPYIRKHAPLEERERLSGALG